MFFFYSLNLLTLFFHFGVQRFNSDCSDAYCLQMKGEKELIEKILNTEINIFLAIRDGSALMQHMEDFYYISLLEVLAGLNHIVCAF